MISIAIYDDNKTYLNELQNMIQNYLIDTHSIAKVSIFDNAETLLLTPQRYDVYIMDTDSSEDIYKLSHKID